MVPLFEFAKNSFLLKNLLLSKFQEVKQLITEIDILKGIRHHRVVAYYGSAEEKNHLLLFIELMTGVSLKKSNIKSL